MFSSPEDTRKECEKCIQCGICEKKCPIHFSTSSIVTLYKHQKYNTVHDFIYSNHPFPIICGYICPNHFCMNNCPKNVDIKELHRHLAISYDWEDRIDFKRNGKRIAIVGGGVSGLTCAWFLRHLGYTIDLYEKDNKLGGELNLIPEERLPKDKLEKELNRLKGFIDNLHLNCEFSDLLAAKYDKIFYCIGSKPKILNNLHGAIDYKTYLSELPKEENIAIIGGGNVALDCALHNKGHSTIFVRRNLWDMRIDKKDFQTLIDKKISVVDNFTPISSHNNELFGTFYDCHINQKFSKIIMAIGKEDNMVENIPENGLIIKPSSSVIETIATTLEQLKNYLDK